MKTQRLLLISLALLFTIKCFAGREVELDGTWDTTIKTEAIQIPIQAWIESSKEMLFEFNKKLGLIHIIITDTDGQTVYNEDLDVLTNGSLKITLTNLIKPGSILTITDDNGNNVFGIIYPE